MGDLTKNLTSDQNKTHIAHIRKKDHTGALCFQSCTDHARNTAELASRALEKHGLGHTAYLAGLLHDCGKFTDEFDAYLLKAASDTPDRKGSVIHTFAGVRYVLSRFHAADAPPTLDDLPAEVLAASIGGHHGLMDLWDERHQSGFAHRLKKQPDYDQRAIIAFHRQCADEKELRQLYDQAREEILVFYQQRILPHVTDPEEGYFMLGLLVRLLTSAVVTGDRTDTACFMSNTPLPASYPAEWSACVAQIEAHLESFPCLSAVQQARRAFSEVCAAAAENPPGLYRLDLPTGGGKTLSALRFAATHARKHSLQRVFYVAPLLSILEQNAAVIRAAVGNALPVLEHHSNVLRDNESPEEASHAELLQESWDTPIVITSLVQLLETMFSGKMSSVRRFHALCGSVIIIDEIQSLPGKLLSMFNATIGFLTRCCGATVVLCSATQPAFDHPSVEHPMPPCQRLVSEEVFRQYAPLFRRTEISDGGSCTMAELALIAEELLAEAESLLIVCNTKREAAELYQLLTDVPETRRFHLSAGMCMAHRKQVLQAMTKALEQHTRIICVSTQVIEAGIDVSFGAVIRLSAGLDNVVQAAGRCNRHGESTTPRPVRVYRLLGEKLGPLRDIKASQDALNALLENYRRKPALYGHDLTSDAAVRAYYGALFGGMARGAQDDPTHGQTLFDLLSVNSQWADENCDAWLLNQAFRSAGNWFEVFDSASETVIVPYGKGKELISALDTPGAHHDLARAAALLAEAKQYTVSLTESTIERMLQKGVLFTLLDGATYALNEDYYDSETGVKEGNDACGTLIL